jgi:hypothetical protein
LDHPVKYYGFVVLLNLPFSIQAVLKGGDDITLYEGVNVTDVEEKYHKAQKSWMSLLVPIIPWKQENIYFSPFQSSCIGVVTTDPYTLSFGTKCE